MLFIIVFVQVQLSIHRVFRWVNANPCTIELVENASEQTFTSLECPARLKCTQLKRQVEQLQEELELANPTPTQPTPTQSMLEAENALLRDQLQVSCFAWWFVLLLTVLK